MYELELRSVKRIREYAQSAHYIDLTFRVGGQDISVQADFLREILRTLEVKYENGKARLLCGASAKAL